MIAGRTGQEFNKRKGRKGAYWEDRYHATAIEADKHLFKCLVYIDLNMVRAGVVGHPSEWGFCGYNEILTPRQRYVLIDHDGLKSLLNFDSMDDLSATYGGWIEEALGGGNCLRDGKWTESVAVGSEAFVSAAKGALGNKGEGRAVIGGDGSYELREPPAAYMGIFWGENAVLRPRNECFWGNTG